MFCQNITFFEILGTPEHADWKLWNFEGKNYMVRVYLYNFCYLIMFSGTKWEHIFMPNVLFWNKFYLEGPDRILDSDNVLECLLSPWTCKSSDPLLFNEFWDEDKDFLTWTIVDNFSFSFFTDINSFLIFVTVSLKDSNWLALDKASNLVSVSKLSFSISCLLSSLITSEEGFELPSMVSEDLLNLRNLWLRNYKPFSPIIDVILFRSITIMRYFNSTRQVGRKSAAGRLK